MHNIFGLPYDAIGKRIGEIWNRRMCMHMERKPEQQICNKSVIVKQISNDVVFVMLNERIINVILFGDFPAAWLPMPPPTPL